MSNLSPSLIPIKSAFGETYFASINSNVFEGNHSFDIYARSYKKQLEADKTLYLIIGTDSGLLLDYVAENATNGSRYLFVEIEELVPYLEETRSKILSEDIQLATLENWEEKIVEMGFSIYVFMTKTQVILSLAALDAHYIGYTDIVTTLENDFQKMLNEQRTALGVNIYHKLQLLNVYDNVVTASPLRDAFVGKSCVIIAGGPSAPQTFDWIKANRHKLVVIGVSRMSKAYMQAGITPDFVFSLDPFPENFATSNDVLDLKDTILVHGHHLETRLLTQWNGPKLLLGTRFAWKTDLNDENNIRDTGPSVANGCLLFAVNLGFKNIGLAGVDFCFSPEGYSHATGTLEHKTGRRHGFNGHRVKTYSGKTGLTIPGFDMARNMLEYQGFGAKRIGVNVYNFTEDAAEVASVSYLPIEEFPCSEADIDAKEVIASKMVLELDSSARVKDIEAVTEELKSKRNEIGKIKDLAEKALEYNKKMFTSGNESLYKKFKKKMDQVEEEIHENSEIERYIKLYGLKQFFDFIRPDNFEWDVEEVESVGKSYYDAYVKTCDNIISDIDNALARGKLRLLEEDPNTSLEKLAEFWRKENHLGRVNIWLDRFSDGREFTEAEKVIIKSLQEGFQSQREDIKRQWEEKLIRQKAEENIPRKIFYMLRRQEYDSLESLLSGLNDDEEANRSNVLLAEGAIYELDEKPEQALEKYRQIEDSELGVQTLQRIVLLEFELQQYAEALETLSQLVKKAPHYMPWYADMLKAMGKNQESIDVYTEYLTRSPDDYATFIKLGRLYQQLGVKESALFAYKYVLSKDPENRGAKQFIQELEGTD